MKQLARILNLRVTPERMDVWLPRWGNSVAAPVVVVLAVFALRKHTQGQVQFWVGVGAALLLGVLMVVAGTLTARLERAAAQRRIPLRSRLGEFAGYVLGVAVLAAGACRLPAFAHEEGELVIGLLLLLSASLAVISLGMGSTVWRKTP